VNVQIFGTDISEKNIEKARAGVYPLTIADDVSEVRLKKFFVKTSNEYQISKAIREMCVFAKHDLTRDPPFSNLDIVSCRNVLIYFKLQAQRKIIPLFHYALKPDGFLLLGKSESISGFHDLFSPLNKGIAYSKRSAASKAHFGMVIPETYAQKGTFRKEVHEKPLSNLEKIIDRTLVSSYTPPGVVVNENMDILIFRGDVAPYMGPSSGEATLNLLKIARKELRLELQTALYLVRRQKEPIKREGIRFRYNGGFKEIDIEVIPIDLSDSEEPYFLILFEGLATVKGKAKQEEKLDEDSIKDGQITDLRQELASTKETLQTIIEEQEATNEELRAALEEVQSSNEELQSTNEELETAKEELQSTNEELNTLNEELTNRNRELTRMHDDLDNLFSNINIGVIVLNSALQIRLFNSTSEKIFNLISTDEGRPITDIKLKLKVHDLEKKLNNVLENFVPKQEEVEDEKDHWYDMRIRPYLTAEKKIEGLVLTFADIDAVIQSRNFIEKSRDFAQNVLETIHEPLVVLDADLQVLMANPSFYKLFRIKPAETEGNHIQEVGDREWAAPKFTQALDKILSTGKTIEELIVRSDFPDGTHIFSLNMRLLPSLGGKEILITAEDITESKQRERKQNDHRKVLEQRLESAEHLSAIGQTAGMVGHDIRNPLQAIISATYLAKDDLASLPQNETKESLVESMKEIEEQANYINKIVLDLQDYARPLNPNMEEINLRQLLNNLIMTTEINEDIKITTEIANNIQTVHADPTCLQRILTNLITNAEQAMPNGGKITITATKQNGICHITVEDTGEGIPEEIKPKIFTPLFTTKSKGQGFGLAASKRLANAMGGDLTFESETGNGTKFIITLPTC
jgi:two-component system CheB/CheR fusion protein